MIARLRGWARSLKRELAALFHAARDPRTPWAARLLAMAVVAYALSPIDLIPDVVPVLGLLDDLVLVPLGLWLAIRLIPPALLEEHRRTASQDERLPTSRTAAAIIIFLWAALAAAAVAWLVRIS